LTNPAQVVVPAAEFAGTTFWKRANATAADRGHGGHPTMLVGEQDPNDVYRLHCQLCDTTIIEITVDRSSASVRPA
jgi:hypothetical protein